MDEDTAREVAAFVREYSDAFVRSVHEKDSTLLRAYCAIPSMSLGPNGPTYTMTAEENDARWARAAAAVPEDYGNSVLHTVDVTMCSPTAAFVTAECSRYRKDGSEYVRFWASYTVSKTPVGWRVASWISTAPSGPAPARRF
jgi:hypothetical protein